MIMGQKCQIGWDDQRLRRIVLAKGRNAGCEEEDRERDLLIKTKLKNNRQVLLRIK